MNDRGDRSGSSTAIVERPEDHGRDVAAVRAPLDPPAGVHATLEAAVAERDERGVAVEAGGARSGRHPVRP